MVATSRPLSTEKQLHTQRQMPHIASTIIPFRGPKDKKGKGGFGLCCTCLRRRVWFIFRTRRFFVALRKQRRAGDLLQESPAGPAAGENKNKTRRKHKG